jgi:hypothetical protein
MTMMPTAVRLRDGRVRGKPGGYRCRLNVFNPDEAHKQEAYSHAYCSAYLRPVEKQA